VNGAGAVNGFRLSYQQRLVGIPKIDIRKKIIIILIVVALIVSAPYILVYSFPKEKVEIDGYFMDWLRAQIYHDDPDSQNPDIAITAYGMKYDAQGSYFYVRTEGTILEGRGSGSDGFFIFVDTDNDPESGYSVRGLGADALISVVGWNRTLMSAGTFFFNGSASSLDFEGFDFDSVPVVAFMDGEMELSSAVAVTERSRVVVCARHTNIKSDWSDANFRVRGPAVQVQQVHDAMAVLPGTVGQHVLTVRVTGKGPVANIDGFTFDFLGNVTPVVYTAVEGEDMLGSASGPTMFFDRPVRVGHGNSRTIEIFATFPETSIGDSFGLEINKSVGVTADPNVTWVVDSIQTRSKVSYIGLVPDVVVIDGAFGDWSSKAPILDLLGDAYSNRTLDMTSGDVDIDTVKLASTTDMASFYMSVNGTMLGGSSVPTSMVRFVTPGPPAVNVTNITVPMYGADFAFVFIDIDRDQHTGFYVGGSEASIAVIGKDNEILSSRLFVYNDSKWTDAGEAKAAIDSYQLEVSAPYSALGLVSGQNYPITFLAQDWSGREDDIAVALPARITAGTMAFGGILINEIYNRDQGKPTDWIELYNTGTEPINLGGWELWVNGVLTYTFPSVTVNPGEFYVAYSLDFGKGTNFLLLDDAGSTVDQCTAPGWQEKTWGRTGSPPYDTWTTMTLTPGAINQGQVPIPEFEDAIVPLAIVPIMLFAIRRARAGKREAEE